MEFDELVRLLESSVSNLHTGRDLEEFLSNFDEFVVFGAGGNGRIVKDILEERIGKKVVAFVDNSPAKWGTIIDGVRVYPPDYLKRHDKRMVVVISSLWFVEIYKQLNEMGYYLFRNCAFLFSWWLNSAREDYGRGFVEYFLEHVGEFEKVYDLLMDVSSKDVFVKVAKSRAFMFDLDSLSSEDLPCKPEDFSRLLSQPSIFEKNIPDEMPDWAKNAIKHHLRIDRYQCGIVDLKDKKTVIDGGAYIGDTAGAFACINPKATIFAFEPFEDSFKKLEVVSQLLPSIVPVKKALWKASSRLRICLNGPDVESARVDDSDMDGGVEAISLDEFCMDRGVEPDFIKLDVEGAEGEVIEGALSVIANLRPEWAISIYHSARDLWRIPLRMYEMGYKIYIRHRDPSPLETICFAVNHAGI